MASKVTPLYAETHILLNLWALDKIPASKSKFISSKAQAYKTALSHLVEDGALTETFKTKSVKVYDITENGKEVLAKGLADEDFAFSSAGAKIANALLRWFRQNNLSVNASNGTEAQSENHSNGKDPKISSYKEFTKTALEAYDRLNQDYNLDDLVPIYRIRREMGDRLPRKKFNEWLLEVQANDLVQLMGGDLPNVTSDQLEDSVAIPGGGTRFYVKRL